MKCRNTNHNHNYMQEYIYDEAMKEYKIFLDRAVAWGAKVKNGINISIESLKKYLDKENLVILAGEHSSYLHVILLIGYNEQGFIACDPLYNKKQVKSFNEIDKFMDTPLGKWCLAVKKNNVKK